MMPGNETIGNLTRCVSTVVLLTVCGCALDSSVVASPEAIGDVTPTAFGVTAGGGFLTVSSGAGLVYKVRQASGDITSILWNGVELNDRAKGSHRDGELQRRAVGRGRARHPRDRHADPLPGHAPR